MTLTVNNWPAYTSYSDPHLVTVPIPGVPKRILGIPVPGVAVKILAVKATAALWVQFAQDYHAYVQPIKSIECFQPRNIAGTNFVSAHAGGAAVDINSASLPQHAHSMDAGARLRMHRLLVFYPILEWGGDWSAQFLDEMHTQFSQNRVITQADVDAQLAKGPFIRPVPPVVTPPSRPASPEEELFMIWSLAVNGHKFLLANGKLVSLDGPAYKSVAGKLAEATASPWQWAQLVAAFGPVVPAGAA